MTYKEFTYWMKGIVDSTEFVPTKKTWDTIVDKIKTVEDEEVPLHYTPQPMIPMPDTTDDNPYKHIICDASESPKGSADDGRLQGPDLDNVYKDELI